MPSSVLCGRISRMVVHSTDWISQTPLFNGSWEDLILRLTQSVSDSFQATKPLRTVAAFLDYSKAYDHVWRQDLIITMFETGVPLQILRWVKAFLQNRHARVLFNGTLSKRRKMLQGPQGSVLAPLLLLFYINGPQKVIPDGVFLGMYADDVCLLNTTTNQTL